MKQESDDISSRLKRVREYLGFSQREFAKELGVTNGAIALWESGKRSAPGPVMRLLEIYEAELGLLQLQGPIQSELDQILTSRIARNLKYLKISKMTLHHWILGFLNKLTKSQNSPTRRKSILAIADQISSEIGKMKGLPMKLAQMLSFLEVGLQPELNAALGELQTQSSPMSGKLVQSIVEEELGENPLKYFDRWSSTPLSSASIGQVHLARLKTGESVAVKVQYPGVLESIESDLKSLAKLSKFNRLLFQEAHEGDLLNEMRDRLSEECDYRIEAQNQLRIKQNFSHLEGAKIPQVYLQHSTRRVLVTEFSSGLSFSDFVRESTQDERNRAAETIWQLTFESWIRNAFVQVDPHPGNYLFEDSKVVFLDFGSMKSVPAPMLRGWKLFFRAMIDHQFEKALELLEEFGLYPREEVFDGSFLHVLKLLYEPYITNKPYTFSTQHCQRNIHEWFVKGPKSHFKISRDWIFLMRVVWGTASILAKLGATANWQQKVLPLLYEEPKTKPSENLILLPRSGF